MKYSKINQIFWGLIIVFIDINIQNIDIFPDFIGMIIVVTALPKLREHSALFEPAYKFGIASLIMDVITFIADFLLYGDMILISLALTVIGIAIYIAFIYHMMGGLAEMAKTHGAADTERKLLRGRNYGVLSSILGLGATLMVLVGLSIIATVIIVTGLLLYIYVLYSIRSAYNTILSDNRKDPEFGGLR